MKEVLSNILDGYLFEKSQTFSGNELADLIRRAAPLTIQNKAAISEARYKVQGGPGQGQWAEHRSSSRGQGLPLWWPENYRLEKRR